MKSICEQRGSVVFPAFAGERHYMIPFTKCGGLPFDLRRWQPTVDSMLDGIETDGPIYFMADQGLVKAGTPQRRPGLHIDGYWIPAIQAHGHGRHDVASLSGAWESPDRWNFPEPEKKKHLRDEAIILASTVSASRAFLGEWDANIGEGGDCTHVDTSDLRELILDAGQAYAGNVTMLHESLPLPFDVQRTLVRLNVPGWSPKE